MKISIIIPVFNASKYLSACLDSCLSQTYENIEILIVNDGSTDNSQNIINKYVDIDSRVKFVYQQNAGLVEARRTGVRNIRTDYFVFLDADDILTNDAVNSLVVQYTKSPSDIVFANFIVERESGSTIFESSNSFRYGLDNISVLKSMLRREVLPPIWGKMIKTSFFLQTDVPSNLTIGEDAMAWMQILTMAPSITYSENKIYHYVQRRGSMVNQVNGRVCTQRLCFIKSFVEYVSANFEYEGLEDDIKCYIICDIYTYLRDLGEFSQIKDYYNYCTKEHSIFEYKSCLGILRMLSLKVYALSPFLGKKVFLAINSVRRTIR